jgi:hypothetical protein
MMTKIDRPPLFISNWRAIGIDTVAGSFSVSFEPGGLTIHGCLLHRRDGKEWITFPTMLRAIDGKLRQEDVLGIRDFHKFESKVIPLVKDLAALMAMVSLT